MAWLFRLLDVSLETANKFYTFGWAASLTGAAITFVGVVFLMWGTRVRDHDFETQMTDLNVEAGSARERAGKLEERAATISLETERLRSENLALERAIAPRILTYSDFSKTRLQMFGKISFWIMSALDAESLEAGKQIEHLALSAEWTKFDGALPGMGSTPTMFAEGILVEVNTRAAIDAATELVRQLNEHNFEARLMPTPTTQYKDIGPIGVKISVGPKSKLYFARKHFPPGFLERLPGLK